MVDDLVSSILQGESNGINNRLTRLTNLQAAAQYAGEIKERYGVIPMSFQHFRETHKNERGFFQKLTNLFSNDPRTEMHLKDYTKYLSALDAQLSQGQDAPQNNLAMPSTLTTPHAIDPHSPVIGTARA